MAKGDGPQEVDAEREGGAQVPPKAAVLETRRGAGISLTSSAPAERAADPNAGPGAPKAAPDFRPLLSTVVDSSIVSNPLTIRGRPIGSIGPIGSGRAKLLLKSGVVAVNCGVV